MNILWVENQPRFAQIAITRFLSAHTVTVVPSLAAARQALATEHFTLVLLDYDLDDGKGTALLAEIKHQPTPAQVIAASSHAAGNQKLVDAGANAVCSKMEFTNIEHVIRQVFASHPQ